MVRIGIIGLGHWGPNLVRNFDSLPGAKVTSFCDSDYKRLSQVSERFPNVYGTDDANEIIDKKLIDAVVIVTPTSTHYSLAKKALEQGIHAFVEKPLTKTTKECQELINISNAHKTVLQVGHVFLYNSAVMKLKDLVDKNVLGNISYISSDRLNLGPIRQDVNALWDLAPHDISIVLNLINSDPVSVNCQGVAHINKKIHDVCSLGITFENGSMALIRVSWLDPNKTRRMTVVGDKQMAVYDDIDPMEKIKVFDKGVETEYYTDTFGEFQINCRYGDTFSPRIAEIEPLKAECEHFIDCIKDGKKSKTDGENGLEVVRILEAADKSLENSGGMIKLDTFSSTRIQSENELLTEINEFR